MRKTRPWIRWRPRQIKRVSGQLSSEERGISGMSTAEGPGVTGPTEDQEEATLDPTGKRFSAPDSDSEELVPVDTETDTVQEG